MPRPSHRLSTMAETPLEKRMTAALRVFIDAVGKTGQDFERIDKALLDHFIARIDEMISRQLDEILHHPRFQMLESAWRGLAYMLEHCDEKADVKVDLIDISKEDLAEDFEEARRALPLPRQCRRSVLRQGQHRRCSANQRPVKLHGACRIHPLEGIPGERGCPLHRSYSSTVPAASAIRS